MLTKKKKDKIKQQFDKWIESLDAAQLELLRNAAVLDLAVLAWLNGNVNGVKCVSDRILEKLT